MHNAIVVGVVPAWLFVAYKTIAALRRPNRSPGFLWLSALLAACAFSLRIPSLYDLVCNLAGVPNVSRVIINLFMVGSMASALRFLDGVDPSPRSGRLPYLLALLVGVLLVGSFPFEHLDGPDLSLDFIEHYGGNPAVFVSRGAYMAFLAGGLIAMSRRFWSIATRVHPLKDSESTAIGAYVLCVGALLMSVYASEEVVRIVSRFVWSNSLSFLHKPFFIPFLAGILLMLSGGICGVWGNRLGAARLYWWGWHKLSWHRLRALYVGVRRTHTCYWLEPQMPVWAEWLTVRDVRRLHLSRHFDVIDGWSKAREYADTLAGELLWEESYVERLTPDRAEVEANSANLRCALEARSWGLPPIGKTPAKLYEYPGSEPSSAYFQMLSMVYNSPRIERAVEKALAIRRSHPESEGRRP